MELKTYFAQDAAGNIISSAVVNVFLQGTNTLASGLTRADGTPLDNPFAADGAGRIQFRAPDGYYDVQVTAGSGIIQTLTIQCVDYSGAKADADRAEAAAYRADISAEQVADAVALRGEISDLDGAEKYPDLQIARWRDEGDVRGWGAKGDGVWDDTAAIQAALTHADNKGGGRVYLPRGRHRFAASPGSSLVIGSNTTLCGDGDASVIFFDDKDTDFRHGNDLLVANNVSNVAFENFRIEGTALTYANETNQKQCLTGSNIDGLKITGVTIEKVRYMATAFGDVKNVLATNNKLKYIVRDGLRFVNAESVIISDNILQHVTDDAIAVHALDASTIPGAGVVITNNDLDACQGIKTLGAKVLTIEGNILRRTIRNPIQVNLPYSGIEGNTPVFAVSISNNQIIDTFGSRGTNYAIRVAVSAARTKGGLSTQPGVNSAPYAYNYGNDIDVGGAKVNLGAWGINIDNNTIARTLPSGSAYSAWGYGQLFDRATPGFVSDPVITETDMAIHGINTVAPMSGLTIDKNRISGCGAGFTAILLQITGSTNIQDYTNTLIQNNQIIDCPGSGISSTAVGSGSGSKQIIIQNNLFDLDPFFRAASHNADNTWATATGVVGIVASNTIGMTGGGNIFKNCGQPGIVGSVTTESSPNIVYADFAGPGDNAGNKGVRQLPSASTNIIIPIDGDPASPTYGQIANAVNMRSAVLPVSGRYLQGHRVLKDTPSPQGSAGSRYVVTGWWRATTGSGHDSGVDWIEMRSLTGN